MRLFCGIIMNVRTHASQMFPHRHSKRNPHVKVKRSLVTRIWKSVTFCDILWNFKLSPSHNFVKFLGFGHTVHIFFGLFSRTQNVTKNVEKSQMSQTRSPCVALVWCCAKTHHLKRCTTIHHLRRCAHPPHPLALFSLSLRSSTLIHLGLSERKTSYLSLGQTQNLGTGHVYVRAHGKRRGFSPRAAARHSKYARVHTDFFVISTPGLREPRSWALLETRARMFAQKN